MKMCISLYRTPIASLFVIRRPVAIAWLVAAIIVSAFKGEPGWAWSHICKEVLERKPPFADANAAPTVVLPACVIGVGASLNHGAPPREFGGLASGACLPMLQAESLSQLFSPFTTQASAASNRSITQLARSGNVILTAVASAEPRRGGPHLRRPLHRNESPETLSEKIYLPSAVTATTYGVAAPKIVTCDCAVRSAFAPAEPSSPTSDMWDLLQDHETAELLASQIHERRHRKTFYIAGDTTI